MLTSRWELGQDFNFSRQTRPANDQAGFLIRLACTWLNPGQVQASTEEAPLWNAPLVFMVQGPYSLGVLSLYSKDIPILVLL